MSTINGTSSLGVDPTMTASPQASTTAASANSTAALTSENTFLKLLVAQIKNQDPTNPTDPTQFVAQLTQYSELEQLIQINGNIKTMGGTPAVATPNPGGAVPVPSQTITPQP